VGACCFFKGDHVRVAGIFKVVAIHRLGRVTTESGHSLLDCQSLFRDDLASHFAWGDHVNPYGSPVGRTE
jgi:hypothetical protein